MDIMKFFSKVLEADQYVYLHLLMLMCMQVLE